MTFANAVNKELRNTFGPQWIANGMTYAIILAGLLLVGSVGYGLMDFADTNIVQLLK